MCRQTERSGAQRPAHSNRNPRTSISFCLLRRAVACSEAGHCRVENQLSGSEPQIVGKVRAAHWLAKGHWLLILPPCSPDLNPIKTGLLKTQGAAAEEGGQNFRRSLRNSRRYLPAAGAKSKTINCDR